MHAKTATAIVLATFVGLAPATSAASEPTQAPIVAADALAGVRPGLRVRIKAKGGRVVEGRYIEIRDGDVVLDEPAARLPAASIQDAWLRGREAKNGATIGGTILGASGAILGLFVGGYCESDCSSAGWLVGSAAGFGIGAAVGAFAGGTVGAAIPKWRRIDGGAVLPRSDRGPVPDGIGAFSIQGGWAKGRDGDSASGGFGSRLGLSAQLPGGLATGVEFGRFDLGRGSVTSPRGRALDFNESVRHLGFTLTKTRDHGRLRPYALAGVGHYSWHGFDSWSLHPEHDFFNAETQRSFFGASLGGGAHWRARRHLSLEMEGRWHTSLHKVARPTFDGPAQHWNLVSITAGAKVLW